MTRRTGFSRARHVAGLLLVSAGMLCHANADADTARYALVLGIRDYASFERLPTGPEGVQSFVNRVAPLLHVTPARMVVMTDAKDGTPLFPKASNLGAQLAKIGTTPETSNVFTFAVFGRVALVDSVPVLVPADMDPAVADTQVTVESVARQLAKAKHPFLFAVLRNSSGETPQAIATSMAAICSKAGIGAAIVIEPEGCDATAAAIEGLRTALTGAADFLQVSKTDGLLTARELANCLTVTQPLWAGEHAARIVVAASEAGASSVISHYEPPAAKNQADRAWQSVQSLGQVKGLERAWNEAEKQREAANQLMAKGRYADGLRELAEVTAACGRLSSLNKQRLAAVEAQKGAAQMAKEAESADVAESSPQAMVQGFEIARRAELSFATADFQTAERDWREATRVYGQACLAPVRKRVEDRVKGMDFESLAAYATHDWQQANVLLEKARAAVTSSQHLAAIDAYNKVGKGLDQVAATAVPKLMERARLFDKPKSAAMALVFAAKALRLEPDDAEAQKLVRRLRCNSRFQPGQQFTDSHRIAYVFVPAGEFTMGSPESEAGHGRDEIEHKVQISHGFFLGVTEVTQTQWDAVMGNEYRPAQGIHRSDKKQGYLGPNLPKHTVTWLEAILFCERLSKLEGRHYRLPTEAEWEYACRAGTTTPYHTGKDILSSQQASIYDPVRDDEQPREAGTYDIKNAWGLKDMHGNMWEWCSDWYGPYSSTSVTDPTGIPDSEVSDINLARRVVRGGSWRDDAAEARSANRHRQMPQVGGTHIGIRLVLDAADVDL